MTDDPRQLPLIQPEIETAMRDTSTGQPYDRCGGRESDPSVLYIRGCKPRMRRGLQRYQDELDITSRAQAARLLIAEGLRLRGML